MFVGCAGLIRTADRPPAPKADSDRDTKSSDTKRMMCDGRKECLLLWPIEVPYRLPSWMSRDAKLTVLREAYRQAEPRVSAVPSN